MPKTLRLYPRLSYVFSFILHLNTYYLITAIGVNVGEIGAKRAVFGSILEQKMKMHKDGWNVATSPRRDIPTLRRWVN